MIILQFGDRDFETDITTKTGVTGFSTTQITQTVDVGIFLDQNNTLVTEGSYKRKIKLKIMVLIPVLLRQSYRLCHPWYGSPILLYNPNS